MSPKLKITLEMKEQIFSPLYLQNSEQVIQMGIIGDILFKRREAILVMRYLILICLPQKLHGFKISVLEELTNDFTEIQGRLKYYMGLWTEKSLDVIKLYISMIYHLICSTLVNPEGAVNSGNCRFLSFVQMHFCKEKKKSSAVLHYGFWLKSHA